jgi:hypothetical protein
MTRTTSIIAICLLVCSLALIGGCEPVVTEDNYAQIKVGMTLGEVEAILGEGEKEEVGGYGVDYSGVPTSSGAPSKTNYVWKEEHRQIVVTIEDGKVISRSKTGF